MKNMNPKTDIKPILGKMVAEGRYEANFGQLVNARYFANLLANKNIQSRIDEILGNAKTVDTDPSVKLTSHFHVKGMNVTYKGSNAAHDVLKKFV
jgi:hypothetical protein